MQRLNRTIKRIAAIGTGVAMLGATMTGALAQNLNLANYPQPFVDANGVFNENTAIVVGANAAASDTLGAVDIAQRLQFDAKVPVSGGEGTLVVSGGVTEDIPLGKAIGNDTTFALDWRLDDSNIESFQDTQVNFQGKDYDVRDLLIIVNKDGGSPSIETSLSSSDDDYEDNIFMEAERASIRYFYYFDDPVNVSKTKSGDTFDINFLGKKLEITKVDKQDTFTAFVGSEFFMDVGDTVTVDGKKVTLENVGEGGAILVDVDGVRETIPGSGTRTVNGIEISNDETFFTNEISERSASLIIGETAQDTYKDGDAYVGEDENDPDWIWNIGNLTQNAATGLSDRAKEPSGPFIGIENDFVKNDDTDDPAGVGECYDVPNNYASICLDSLIVSDDDYLTLSVEFSDGVDTAKSKHPNGTSSAKTIYIHAPGDDRFVIKTAGWLDTNTSNTVSNAETSEIWLQYAQGVQFQANGTSPGNATMVFFKDPDQTPSTVYAGFLTGSNASQGPTTIAQLDFGSTDNTNMVIQYTNAIDIGTQSKVLLNFTGDSSSELADGLTFLAANFSFSSGLFNALGGTKSLEEANELVWKATGIGTRDEDHRGLYGEIVKDPKSNGASDQVIVLVPGDQVQANVVVKGTSTTVGGGTTSYIPADIDIDTRLDSEIGTPSNFDLILVGGPCANNAVEAVTGLGITCESARSSWNPGEAVIKMAQNGDKVALLVAGYNAIDTRMAAKVLKNYDDYTLSGSMAKVTGSLSSPVVTSA